MIALAMASVEAISQDEGRVIFLSPDEGAVCQGFVRVVVSASNDVNDVGITINNISRYMGHVSQGIFEIRYLVPEGEYTIGINAERAAGDIPKTRNFSMVGFETYPADGETLSSGNYALLLAAYGAADLIASVEAHLDSQDPVELARNGNTFDSSPLSFTAGSHQIIFTIVPAGFPEFQQIVAVTVEEA
jgi:hypothetical protein